MKLHRERGIMRHAVGYMLRLGTLILLATLPLFKAHAVVTCGPYEEYNQNVVIPIIGNGIITAGEELPVGTVLYTQTYVPVAGYTGYRCNYASTDLPVTVKPYKRREALTMPLGGPTLSGNQSIFPTNVPGIGVYIGTNSIGGSGQYPITENGSDRVITSGSGSGNGSGINPITLRLVKTGAIPSSAQVQAALFPTIQLSHGITSPAPWESPYLTVSFSGMVNVVNRTCQIDDVDVELGSHQLTSFTGIGSTTDWKDFNITLRNCPPFHGYYKTDKDLTYSAPGGGITSNNAPTTNRIEFVFKGSNGYFNNMAYLNAGSSKAKGIGVQIADTNETLLPLYGLSYKPTMALTNVDGASYVLPLKARYYQYTNTVTTGSANAAITFTVNYY